MHQKLAKITSHDQIESLEKKSKIREFMGQFVYGGIDGAITTFAVVAGSAGASLSPGIVLILGISNLLADGLSMSIGDYLSSKSEIDGYKKIVAIETFETENFPTEETAEIRQIYRKKGFDGALLEQIVTKITSDKELWVNEMMVGEHGMTEPDKDPLHSAAATFGAFQIMGIIPLLPYVWALVLDKSPDGIFFWSSLFTSMAFVIIGAMKSWAHQTSQLRGILETLLLGGLAALVAYSVGKWLETLV
jgi:VIT1/CCC1 family predicted Fe2+/Mn2+ transporter